MTGLTVVWMVIVLVNWELPDEHPVIERIGIATFQECQQAAVEALDKYEHPAESHCQAATAFSI